MSAVEETFNPASLARSDTISSSVSATKPTSNPVKAAKTTQNYPRVDFEPLYADLKACIAHHWAIYHDALTRFMRGMSLKAAKEVFIPPGSGPRLTVA